MVQTGIDFFKASNGYARTWKAAKGNSLHFRVMKMRKNCKNNIITVYKCQSTEGVLAKLSSILVFTNIFHKIWDNNKNLVPEYLFKEI